MKIEKNTDLLFQDNIGLVAIKKVINPYALIKIHPELPMVETTNMPWITNPFDDAAIKEAVRLKEIGFLQSLIVISIGGDARDILMSALAKGADRAIFIKTNPNDNLTPLNITKILKYIIDINNINMVFLGKQSIDGENNQIGPMLAGLLDWPQGCLVSKIICDATDNFHITVERELDNGIEVVKMMLPAVITFELPNDKQQANTQHVSVSQLMKAKQKPFETILIDQLLSVLVNNQFNFNNIETIKMKKVSTKSKGIRLSNTTELVNLLKNFLENEK